MAGHGDARGLIGKRLYIVFLLVQCATYFLIYKYYEYYKHIAPAPHDICHRIITTGPPVFARLRPLPPDRYKKVKEEFRHMQEMGICRPGQGEWASPLHVVPKKTEKFVLAGTIEP